MDAQNLSDDRWVDDRLASLAPPDAWTPDADRARAIAETRRRSAPPIRRATWALAGAAVAASAIAVVPPMRVFASQCVSVCAGQIDRVKSMLRSADAPAPAPSAGEVSPRAAAEFARPDRAGRIVRLSDLRGRVVLLNFWATWCAPCRAETPWFEALHQRYGRDGLSVIGVSLDEDGWPAVNAFLDEFRVTYPVVLGDEALSEQYGGVPSLPATFLIDRDGRISMRYTGLTTQAFWQGQVEAALARPR